jgi:hypothetical protein
MRAQTMVNVMSNSKQVKHSTTSEVIDNDSTIVQEEEVCYHLFIKKCDSFKLIFYRVKMLLYT